MSTGIQWTDETWNPIAAFDKTTGKRGWFCVHKSPGCEHCYAESMNRFRGNGHKYRVPEAGKLDIRIVEKVLAQPLSWRKPRRVFVCSMTDLFLDEHSDEMIARVFAVMALSPQHTFQVLTKRPERMLAYFATRRERIISDLAATETTQWNIWTVALNLDRGRFITPWCWHGDEIAGPWPLPNVWLGVSVESQKYAAERIPLLLDTPAAVRFLSCEPLLGPIEIPDFMLHGVFRGCPADTDEDGDGCVGCPGYIRPGGDFCPAEHGPRIDWMIIGGESGRKARPCDVAWITSLVAACDLNGVACFVKQLGAVPMEQESEWRSRLPVALLLNAGNHDRMPDGFVPLKLDDSHGGDPDEWPEELRVREFPTIAQTVPV